MDVMAHAMDGSHIQVQTGAASVTKGGLLCGGLSTAGGIGSGRGVLQECSKTTWGMGEGRNGSAPMKARHQDD